MIAYQGSASPDPAAFDTWAWLSSFYTEDGKTVYALVHAEYHGERFQLCPRERAWACWYNALTLVISRDGGATFAAAPSAERLVASAPLRFSPESRNRTGAFSPSNIVRYAGFYYVLFAISTPEVKGVCIMRTDTLSDAKSWRFWNGREFAGTFVDPYRDTVVEPAAHTCTPLAGLNRVSMGSIVKEEASGRFIQVQTVSNSRTLPPGAYYSTSADLVHWSPSRLLAALPTHKDYRCEEPASYGYFSILDPTSRDRNFLTIVGTPYLYFTRFNLEKCKIGVSRDLVRARLKFEH